MKNHEISCVATQTRVAPVFHWFIGETLLKNANIEINEKKEEDDRITYISKLNYQPTIEHLAKLIRCEVNHTAYDKQQLENQTNMVQAILDIQFKPIMLSNFAYEKDKVIAKFKANPRPKSGFWQINNMTLQFGSDLIYDNKTFMSSDILDGNQTGDYFLNLTFKVQDDTASEVKEIPVLLEITNEIGKTTLPVSLVEEVKEIPVLLEITNEIGKTTLPVSLVEETNRKWAIAGIGGVAIVSIAVLGVVLLYKPFKKFSFRRQSGGISPNSGRSDDYALGQPTILRSNDRSIHDVT